VQFIGELFKLGMLTERIMHQCVHRLVDYKGVPDEAEIESLCKLLRTIGFNLDQSERGSGMMNAYFARIQQAIDMPELPSRMKFMLMDVVDLRKAGWQSKDGNKGPKTLEEVRAEVCPNPLPYHVSPANKNRPRLLRPPRHRRTPATTSVAVVARLLAVVMLATSRRVTSNRTTTRLVWMT
jgi:translation initiation factor 4G